MFFKISFLQTAANFTGKQLRWSLIFIKLQACRLERDKNLHPQPSSVISSDKIYPKDISEVKLMAIDLFFNLATNTFLI